MELNLISFNNSEGVANPHEISVTMTVEEALWIATLAGKTRGTSPHEGIYRCLVGDVFNCYWEDGLSGAAQDYRIAIPPIKYE